MILQHTGDFFILVAHFWQCEKKYMTLNLMQVCIKFNWSKFVRGRHNNAY